MSGYLRTRLLASHTASHSASQEVIQRDLIISPSLCVLIAVSSLSLIFKHLQSATRRPHKLAGHLRRWGASRHAVSQPSSPANLLASSEDAHKKQSESLANQPARSQANNYPPDQPAGQSQSAIRMPFKHLFFPAMRLSPSRFLSPLPPCPSLSLSLLPFPLRLSLSLRCSDICRGWHGEHISWQRIPGKGGVSKRATSQPSEAASLAASNEAA